MVRLGKKYELEELRQEAKRLLKAQFPESLQDLENLLKGEEFSAWLKNDICRILWIAEESKLRSVLPIAYYMALTLQVSPQYMYTL